MTVRPGLDRVVAGNASLPRSARIALLTNRAARTTDGRWAMDALHETGYRVAVLLAPEHGLDLAADAGAAVGHGRLDDLPVLSLYGADWTPVEDKLTEIDVIVVDLPDVGARYYTYPWTVRELMRLAGRKSVPVTILDRPNPLGGVAIEGNLPELDSAVCSTRAPIRHGLTLGELSLWNRHCHQIDVELDVVPIAGWRREMRFEQTGLPWVPPSPALSNPESVALYPGTCLIEGTTMSEGRGTEAPFRQFGSPNLDAEALIRRLRHSELMAGTVPEPVRFRPRAGKWTGEDCAGVRIRVTAADSFRPVAAGLAIIGALRGTPDFEFLPFFDTLAGTTRLRKALQAGVDPEVVSAGFARDEETFRQERRPVLLY